jgi:predicted nucleotidyltransferase
MARETAMLLLRQNDAIAKLRAHEAELRRLGVEHLYLFGSTARDQARNNSDVDLFFDHRRGELGFFQLMDVKELARKILGRQTDIMTRASCIQFCGNGSKRRRCASSDANASIFTAPHRYH